MPVTKWFIIWSVTVPSTWLALLLAFLLSYVAVRVLYQKEEADLIADSFFWLVIVWKLSVVLTDFKSVVSAPLSILYFHGGVVGFFLGLAVVIVKLFRERMKNRIGLVPLVTAWIVGQSVFQVAMAVLNPGDPLGRWATVVIFTLFLIVYWIKRADLAAGSWIWLAAAVHVFGASFQPEGWLGIPLAVTIAVSLAFGVLFQRVSRSGEIV
ncbi:hypothetical protein OXB_1752 [Bacillus sp. OxB-1]|uniref:hypothetical protein n=1 Tax=Bacillus sp. (strain OxB-1) TaxID=98228 RepID=UPI000581E3C6|nr:hypothetical protein [Bacillus sp. OxB-1]BAQ10223.1 hypothetical protein OXB_1752 [Bacillus sp. OxB-1]